MYFGALEYGMAPALCGAKVLTGPVGPRGIAFHPLEGQFTMTIAGFRNFARRPLLSLGILLGLAATAEAQGIVAGKVADQANGSPLVGARVVVVGSSATATTNAEGRYGWYVPAGTHRSLRRSATPRRQDGDLGRSVECDRRFQPGAYALFAG